MVRTTAPPAPPSSREGVVEEVLARGSMAWPRLVLERAVVSAYVRERVSTTNGAAPGRLHAEDLFLACACATGVPGAIEAFDAHLSQDLARALRAVQLPGVERDETRAELYARLFTGGTNDPRPWILNYRGAGPLGAWLRVCATRLARIAWKRRRPHESASALFDVLVPGRDDPELAALRSEFRDEFRDAVYAAFEALSEKERTLLLHRFFGGGDLDGLAFAERVHRVTVSRWLAQTKAALLARVRTGLAERLGLDVTELDELVGDLSADTEISVERLLRRSDRRPP